MLWNLIGSDVEKKLSKIQQSVPKTTEKSVYADISLGTGLLYLNRGTENQIFEGEFFYQNQSPSIEYEIVGSEGRLTIDFNEFGSGHKDEERNIKSLSSLDDFKENECRLNLSDKIPLSLNLDLGLVKGELDLGGLQIENFDFTSGVSKAYINFNTPNPVILENFNVEAGVGDLEINKIGNSNFRYFNFDGGIGNYVLDFSGQLKHDASINIGVGLGRIKLYLPRSSGVRIIVDESFLSSFSIDDIYKKDDIYYNNNWGNAVANLDFKISSEVGKVTVIWLDE
jgi:hypothetical protein